MAPWAARPWTAAAVEFVSGPVKSTALTTQVSVAWAVKDQPPSGHCWLSR